MHALTATFVALLLSGVSADQQPEPQATSLLGTRLFSPTPSEALLTRFEKHKVAYEASPDDAEKLIWFGRFLAYTGDYRAAIKVFTQGIASFPQDARMYRHRGHRFITIREFDKAIADLDRAVDLIEGTSNTIEPDGMPNAQNIPISTLHGNIYYHKGLAHYLKGDFHNAREAYNQCLALRTNDDNTVSATHWLYMIHRRMGHAPSATRVIAPIRNDMRIIENHSYHRACRFYKGEITISEAEGAANGTPADDAVRYAIGNWFLYNGQIAEASSIFSDIVSQGRWQSFGHIAAEAELARMKQDATAGQKQPLRLLREIDSPDGHLQWVAFSSDGKAVATCGDKFVEMYSASSGQRIHRFKGHTEEIHRFAFSPDGQLIASGSRDRTVRLWDTSSGKLVRTVRGHTDQIIGVSFSPDSKWFASGSTDHTIRVWSSELGQEVARAELPVATNAMFVSFSPDSGLLAATEYRGGVRLYKFDGRSLELQFSRTHDAGEMATHVSFAPSGKTLLTSSWDKTIRLWNAETGEQVWRQRCPDYARCFEASVFSPDGSTIYTVTRDETIQARDAKSGELRASLRGEDKATRGLAISPNGKLLATAGHSGQIRLWQIE